MAALDNEPAMKWDTTNNEYWMERAIASLEEEQ